MRIWELRTRIRLPRSRSEVWAVFHYRHRKLQDLFGLWPGDDEGEVSIAASTQRIV